MDIIYRVPVDFLLTFHITIVFYRPVLYRSELAKIANFLNARLFNAHSLRVFHLKLCDDSWALK